MDKIEARILLKNLLARLEPMESGGYAIQSKVTADEYTALGIAVEMLGGPHTPLIESKSTDIEPSPADKSVIDDHILKIDTSVMRLPSAPENVRICLDFGTALSKATLVLDGESDFDDESITVLYLGEYGDYKEDYKLISAVYIDDEGKLWFGDKAAEFCERDNVDGSRQVMDNIKHWLSLGQVDSEVDQVFNPTDISITYAEIILAYLTFFTWTANKALEGLKSPDGYPRNINRRFALPCLPNSDFREVKHRMRKYLGEAQVLSDTFGSDLRNGLPLQRFVDAVKLLRDGGFHDYRFVKEELTEPLGVAGSLLSYSSDNEHDMIVMVIDVGAGTSDFSVYRIKVDLEKGVRKAWEAVGSVGNVTEAGNHLDGVLMGLILKSCGIDPEQGIPSLVQWKLQRNIREFKEEIFEKGLIEISLPEGYETSITLDQFLQTLGVKNFKNALDRKMIDILESIDGNWVNLIGPSKKIRYLTVALTGGGASLPMVRELADRQVTIRGKQIKVVPAKPVPTWLEEAHSELELDYPSIAVSLGGARKKLIRQAGTVSSIGGEASTQFVYDDPKYQW
ncbi:MAG: hypothetical protein OXH31_02825 [Gammaproteobacteria bacterium]|nr:hypothetical protein [Gammaproteobacteria bacterium]